MSKNPIARAVLPLVLPLMLALAPIAQAQEATPTPASEKVQTPPQSLKKSYQARAGQRAEMAAAQREGKVKNAGEGTDFNTKAPQLKPHALSDAYKGRAGKRAEVAAARKKGELPASNEAQQ